MCLVRSRLSLHLPPAAAVRWLPSPKLSGMHRGLREILTHSAPSSSSPQLKPLQPPLRPQPKPLQPPLSRPCAARARCQGGPRWAASESVRRPLRRPRLAMSSMRRCSLRRPRASQCRVSTRLALASTRLKWSGQVHAHPIAATRRRPQRRHHRRCREQSHRCRLPIHLRHLSRLRVQLCLQPPVRSRSNFVWRSLGGMRRVRVCSASVWFSSTHARKRLQRGCSCVSTS